MDKHCSGNWMVLVWSILLATLYAPHALASNPLPKVKEARSSVFRGISAGFNVIWNEDDIVCRSPKGNIVFSAKDFGRKRFIAQSGIKPGAKRQAQDYFYFQNLQIKSLVGPYLSLECTTSCAPYVNGNPDSANPGNDRSFVTFDLRNPQDLASIVSLNSKIAGKIGTNRLTRKQKSNSVNGSKSSVHSGAGRRRLQFAGKFSPASG